MFKFYFLTQLIELPLFISLFRTAEKRYALLMMALINTFSWPVATLLYNMTTLKIWWVEAIIILLEAILLRYIFSSSWKKSFAISFIINAVSTAIGFIFPGHYAGRL